MPYARICLLEGKPAAYVRSVSDSLHQALVDAFDVPPDDRFQVVHELAPHAFVFDRHYRGGPRSDDYVLIDITAGRPRSSATRRAFYRRLVELLGRSPGIASRDVMVVINTTQADEWSFAGGEPAVDDATAAIAEGAEP